MGQEIKTTVFNENDFTCFHKKLMQETQYLQTLIQQKKFPNKALILVLKLKHG
jgi:hypothetical protein